MPPAYIALDAGTSEIKAALFDERFRQLDEARERVALLRPAPGHCEVEPRAVLEAAVEALARVARRAAARGDVEIAALGLTAAMVGAWTLDENGMAIGNGILWEDSRAEPELARLRAVHPDFDRRVFASSGSALQQGCTLPLMAWMARHEPARLARTAHVVGLKDFLRAQLTGVVATDIGEAAVAPGDARSRGRSAAMLELFELAPFADRLPQPFPSEALAGTLSSDMAARVGLPAGLPIAIGAGDVPSSVLGAGGLRPGTVTAVLGTTCMVGRCVAAPVFEPAGLGLLFTLPGERWYRAMVNVAGTLNLDWAHATLAPDMAGGIDVLEALATTSPPGANGATWLPYLSESGIIAPVVDARARGGFDGIVPSTARSDLLRAVYEGVAFALADCVELLGDDDGASLRLIGGGARSDFWTQMIADVLGRPVERVAGTQFGARGAALLASVAAGVHESVHAALADAPAETRLAMPGVADYRDVQARWRAHRDRRLVRG